MEVGKTYFVVGAIVILISSTFPISTPEFVNSKEIRQSNDLVKIIVGLSPLGLNPFQINESDRPLTLEGGASNPKKNSWKINKDILPLYEVNITTEEFKFLLEKLYSIKEEIKLSKNDNELKVLLEEKLGLFRNLGILPSNFTLNNLINTGIALRETLIRFLKEKVNIINYLEKNNIQTADPTTGNLPGRLRVMVFNVVIPITFLGIQLPYGKLAQDKKDLDHDGNTTEPAVISFNRTANASIISAIESLFRGEQVSWIRKSEFGLSVMEWEFLLIPSIISFTYVIGALGWGEDIDNVLPKKLIKGAALFVQLEVVGFTMTVVAQQIMPSEGVLQYPLVDFGIVTTLISAWAPVLSS